MVHSIELLLDEGSETKTRELWAALSQTGLHSPGETSRPHVTLVVADAIAAEVHPFLAPVIRQLPLPCRIGAATLFGGGGRFTLVRLVVPTVALLSLQAEVHAISEPFLHNPASNTAPGEWTPHITLARRVDPSHMAAALTLRKLARDVTGSFVGLRHWDGQHRTEHEIAHPDRR